jgi:hypothetical protein
LIPNAVERAEAMGRRAGAAFRDIGALSPTLFGRAGHCDLAAIWGRAYSNAWIDPDS